jgi:DNA-binding CsgD family transcriptional regulator
VRISFQYLRTQGRRSDPCRNCDHNGDGECPQRSDRLHAAFCRDVNFDLVSRRWPGAYLTHKTADEIASPQYRRACYGGRGSPTAFRSCAWGRRAPRPSVSIAAAKMGAFPIANSTEPMRFCQLMASADFHGVGKAVNLAPQKPAVEEMQAGLKSHPRMTLRELQVVARVKAGMSARQIAAELGIAETTVITHRSSAYARMGVANLRELLLA